MPFGPAVSVARLEDNRQPVDDPAHAPRRVQKVRSSQSWAFRWLALVIPLLLLAFVEIFLRISDYGSPASFFLKQRYQGQERLVENRAFGRRFFPASLARRPQPVVLAARKPADTTRVFVLGESAAMGDPEPSFGLPRMLQAMLGLKFPSNRFEVINVAMTAINSHAVREIARDCAPLEGDVWIVYMGNNEVVGPFGSGTVFGRRTPNLAFLRAILWLKQFRLIQLAESLTHRSPPEWRGMAMFLKYQVRRDDPRMKKVYAHFQENLRDTLRIGTSAGAKVIVSTVAVNLGDSPPFASQMSAPMSKEQQAAWVESFARGVSLETNGRFEEAWAAFLNAEQIAGGTNHGHAELYFRRARCELALRQYESARVQFNLAKEHDTLRFRADDEINRIIRDVAGGVKGVRFVDGAALLASQSSNGITGAIFFHEHVHLTFEGNYRLARALMAEVVPALPRAVRESGLESFPTMQECAQRLAWTDFNRMEVEEEMRARLRNPPFATQLGHEQRDRALQNRIEAIELSLTPEMQERHAAAYRQALARSPDDWVLRENFARLLEANGRASEAVVQWNEVVRLLPHDAQAYYQIGTLLAADSQPARALPFFREAVRRDSTHVDARHGLALAFTDLGRFAEAERELNAVLRMQPGFVEARVNKGKMLLRQGKVEAAAQEFERVLRRDTNNLHAHLHLGGLLARRGNVAQATTHYEAALRIDSENVTAREGLKKLQSPR